MYVHEIGSSLNSPIAFKKNCAELPVLPSGSLQEMHLLFTQ